MKPSVPFALLVLSAVGVPTLAGHLPRAAVARPTIDVGIVVSDIEEAAAFYGDALALAEGQAFDVDAEFCASAGLTDHEPLAIRVFSTEAVAGATKLKLMEVKGTEPKRPDHAFIHSTLGVSYLTIYVDDLTATLARLAEHDVAPLAKGPVAIDAAGTGLALVRDPDGNLIELIGPTTK